MRIGVGLAAFSRLYFETLRLRWVERNNKVEVSVDSSSAVAVAGREGDGKVKHVRAGCLSKLRAIHIPLTRCQATRMATREDMCAGRNHVSRKRSGRRQFSSRCSDLVRCKLVPSTAVCRQRERV